jgi:hypothetical protein
MSNVIQLRHSLKLGDKVKMGTKAAHVTYTVTKIEGTALFGTADGFSGGERCITMDYRKPLDPRVVVTTLDGRRLQ